MKQIKNIEHRIRMINYFSNGNKFSFCLLPVVKKILID